MSRLRRTTATTVAVGILAVALALAPAATAQAVPLPSGTLSGTIRDANGVAVADAGLNLISGSHFFEATSSASGAYSIPNAPAGQYFAQLLPPAGSTDLALGEFYLDVAAGGTSFDPVLSFNSEISGVVTNSAAATVPGVLVSVTPVDEPNSGMSNGPDGTPADGTFDYTVGAGEWIVAYEPPDGSDYEYQWYSGAVTRDASQDFDVSPTGAGSPFDASVVLVTNTTQVTGLVTRDGLPQAQSFVEVFNAAGDRVAGLYAPTGSFSTAGMPNGTYTLQATHHDNVGGQDYASQVESVTVTGSDIVIPALALVPSPGFLVTGVPDAFTASRDAALTVAAAAGVTSNDSRTPPGDLYAVLDQEPAHGSVFLQWNGGFSYAPADGFVGTDTFTYIPSPYLPSFGASGDPVTVTITVVAPLAATGSSFETAPLAIGLLALIAGLAIVLVHRRRIA